MGQEKVVDDYNYLSTTFVTAKNPEVLKPVITVKEGKKYLCNEC